VSYSVIAISPTDGSAGEQLGPTVARELGFQLVNEQIVAQAAREAGVTPETVADVEKRKGMLHRLLEGFSEVGPAGAAGFTGFAAIAEDPGPNRDALRGLIRSVLEESAEQGNVVIVAHAASLALGGNPDVLRVLITASPETRAKRIAEAQNVDEAEAKKLLASGDANRADYLKRFYDASAESPTHYDIVINTDRVSTDDAAALILGAARSQQIPA
jgi:cytidylate kinase